MALLHVLAAVTSSGVGMALPGGVRAVPVPPTAVEPG
jgi:hypothetical protein